MTKRERNLLVFGLAAGVVVGVAAYAMLAAKNRPNAAQPAAAAASTNDHAMAEMPPENGMQIQLSPEEQKAPGIATYTVARKAVSDELRTVGRVEQAETQLSTISARVGGRLDKLFIAFTGQPVRRGQAVASIYSPQVVASAEEYKLALQARRNLGPGAHAQATAQADELALASRRRLELWGLTREQIDEIASTEAPKLHVTTYSPVQGVVTERKVAEGQYVQEGETLYTVSDFSTVWVLADVYEADLPRIRLGQAAQVESAALAGGAMRGTVSFIDPTVNPQTRTASLRIQMPNPGLRLRPGMFVNVALAANAASELAIPRSAVLDTGEKKVVYVAQENGIFERREVELGVSSGQWVAVRRGLKAGENVVANGAFLVDSQTRVSGGMRGMFGGAHGYDKEAPADQGQYTVSLRLNPDPPKGGELVQASVTVVGSDGKPVADAEVSITFLMPAMPSMGMAEMRNTDPLKWDGKQYSGAATVQTPGPWTVTVDVTRQGQRLATKRAQVTAR